jgi:glucose/arabinose dehydrogenase
MNGQLELAPLPYDASAPRGTTSGRVPHSLDELGKAMEHAVVKRARPHRWTTLPLALFLSLLALPAMSDVAAAAPVLPATFEDRVVTKVRAPTALAFTPDGRLLIASQDGTLHVYQNGAQLASPALDLTSRLCADKERGLLGLAVDPSFASNHFIYLYYTFRKFGVCEYNTSRAPVNRVSRFVLSDDSVIDPATETVLIDNIPNPDGIHNAGDLHFGKDGYLYVSVGDGGCDYAGDSGCGSQNNAARDPHVLLGKILRITTSGGIPTDNPYQGADSARCNTTGRTDAGRKCQETFASGLRNPFRMAFDPNAAGTRFFINDVGQNVWEEIDAGQAGADYGWNIREGHCRTGSSTDCGAPPAGLTNPVYDYHHSTGCTAITAGAFVPNGVWPPDYNNTYLYGDFVCGKIIRLTPAPGGGFTGTDFATGLGTNSITGMIFGPHGSTQALYYMNRLNGGEVHRIAFTGAANRAPTASADANPTSGPTPLDVTFDGSRSSDPDGDALSYSWDFGDGLSGSGARVTHTYTEPGGYTATLHVRDGRGGEDTDSVRIDAGNQPPGPTIESPVPTKRFAVGEVITLHGSATDPEDGPLPNSALTWRVIKHHDDHTHPFLPSTQGNDVPVTGPDPEDLAATTTTYLEIQLTATDSKGLTTTVSQDLRPNLVDVTFQTSPTGLRVEVNGSSFNAPHTITSWAAYDLNVNAPDQTDASGTSWTFDSWSDGGAVAHRIQTGTSPATYTATFKQATTAGPMFRDGFESGDTSRWTNATGLVVQQQHVAAGTYAARGTSTGSTATHASKQLSASQAELYYRFNFNVLSQGANNLSLGKLRAPTGASILDVFRGQSGRLCIRNDASATTTCSSTTVSLGVWHDLQVRAKTGASGDIDVWYDGSPVSSLSLSQSLGTSPIGRVQIGNNQTGRVYDAVFDDAVVDVNFIGGLPPPPATSVTLAPEADARVQEANRSTNYGTSRSLRTDGGADPDVESFLRFTVSGISGSIQAAKLRVHAFSGTGNGPAVYGAGNTWSETGITWGSRPARTSGAHDDKAAISANSWVEYNVKPLVSGNGTYTFVLATTSSDGVDFHSREGSLPPQLVLTVS